MNLFDELTKIAEKPKPFEFYTTPQLWNDPHISKGMLDAHLNPSHDAASYHHELIAKAVSWINSRFNISKGTRICDFGCGPGLYTTRFAELGGAVTGIDLSERSIGYARNVAIKKNLKIEYFNQNYLHYSTDKKFDLITMISRDFPVLSPDQRRTLLRIFYEILDDKGAILLDVDSLDHFKDYEQKSSYTFSSNGGFWSTGPHHVFTHTFKYEHEKVLLEKHTVIEKEKRLELFNWHQCYSQESLKQLFQESGFKIEAYYSNVAGDPYESNSPAFAIIARKSKK